MGFAVKTGKCIYKNIYKHNRRSHITVFILFLSLCILTALLSQTLTYLEFRDKHQRNMYLQNF